MTGRRRIVRPASVIDGRAPDAVQSAVAALRGGQVVAMPTDTVYGLATAIDIPTAIERLYVLKQRPNVKAIPVLLSEAAMAATVCPELPLAAEILARRFWPGPLTIVVPAGGGLPSFVTDELPDGRLTVAIRVPDHALARAIIAGAGGALAVTSANLSGEREALDAKAAAVIGDGAPDVVVDGGRAPGGKPSTIVLARDGSLVLIRRGAIPFEEVEKASNRLGGH